MLSSSEMPCGINDKSVALRAARMILPVLPGVQKSLFGRGTTAADYGCNSAEHIAPRLHAARGKAAPQSRHQNPS